MTDGSAWAGRRSELTAGRPGKGHLAAAPDPLPPAPGNRRELAELITAAMGGLLDGKTHGAEILEEARQMAGSMNTEEILFAGVEAYGSRVGDLVVQLAKTEDQLRVVTAQLQQAKMQLADFTRDSLERFRGQERASAGRRTITTITPTRRRRSMPTPADDVAGQDRRPDPGIARTPGELMAALRQFRLWAGSPSYRIMAERSGWGASTLNTILNSDKMPDRLGKVDAILTGCGGSQEVHQRFASAWRRLSMPEPAARDESEDHSPTEETKEIGEARSLAETNIDRYFFTFRVGDDGPTSKFRLAGG